MRTRTLGVVTAIASLLLLSKTAAAQTAPPAPAPFALQQFEPAPAGDHFFGVPDAAVAGSGKGYFEVLGNYALKPLKLRDARTDTSQGYLTSTQLYLNVDASLALWQRLLLNVDIPFALAQSGDSTVAGLPASNPTGGKIADIRVGARLAIAGGARDPFSFAIAGDIWLPTGNKDNLTSDGKVRANPKAVFSGNIDNQFIYTFTAGALLRPYQQLLPGGPARVGNALTFGAGIAVVAADGKLQIGPELYGNTVLQSATAFDGTTRNTFLGTHSSPIEAILGAKLRLGDVVIGAGAGPGLTKTPGTPQLRALLSIALVPEEVLDSDGDGINDDKDACPTVKGVASPDPKLNGCPPPPPPPPADRDGDGIPDNVDACPDVPGVRSDDPAKNGCPADRDGDGIPDNVDACPDTPGVKSDDPKKNGCPADRDGDGIPDNVDACPDTPGVKSDDPKKNGCPPDRDGDGIPDNVDACPDTPGVADPDPKKNGCPKLATIVGKEIRISEQVHFQTGKATILPDSDKLLGEVAAILAEHKEIDRLVIEGHTDSKGAKGANQILSKNRAESVKTWLSTKGNIDKKRLDAVGFGQTKPIATNDTEEGRALNRRVEFHIAKESVKSSDATAPADTKPAKGAAPAKPVAPPKPAKN